MRKKDSEARFQNYGWWYILQILLKRERKHIKVFGSWHQNMIQPLPLSLVQAACPEIESPMPTKAGLQYIVSIHPCYKCIAIPEGCSVVLYVIAIHDSFPSPNTATPRVPILLTISSQSHITCVQSVAPSSQDCSKHPTDDLQSSTASFHQLLKNSCAGSQTSKGIGRIRPYINTYGQFIYTMQNRRFRFLYLIFMWLLFF